MSFKWDGTHGGMLAIWAKNITVIKQMIAKHQLAPVQVKIEIIGRAGAKLRAPAPIRWPKVPFPGIPVPHLHYGGKIYPVNVAQWNKFSGGVIKDVAGKLGRASAVGPETLEALTELSGGIK